MNKKLLAFLLSFFFFLNIASVYASGGIGLGATRVVYPENSAQVPLVINNSTDKMHYLINSWVEDESGNKTQDFLITPPIYVSKPQTETSLNIVKIIERLPKDRESLYYLNVKAVPASDKKTLENNNVLQLAVLSSIKLFVRPESLKPIEHIEQTVKVTKKENSYYVTNSTPFYLNMIQVKVDNKLFKNGLTIKPFSEFKLPQKNIHQFSFNVINDYGGVSKETTLAL